MKPTEIAHVIATIRTRFPAMLERMGQPNLEALLAAASVLDVLPGRSLFRDRMPVDYLYLVLDGTLSAYIEEKNQSKKIGEIHPGEWLGEVSVLSGEMQASATVVADTPCTVVKLHHLSFEKLIAEHEGIAKSLLEQFIELMAKRLRAPMTSVAV
jgi:cAMP-dependent protein kinase regulator